jgi:starvation-inducible outer membrane lipoprotein
MIIKNCSSKRTHFKTSEKIGKNITNYTYWVIQNDCGQVWQLCTKIYVAIVWAG